jgi:hypothetical protein
MCNRGFYLKKLGAILESEEKILEKEKKSDITNNTENDINLYEKLNLVFSIFKNIFFIADKEFIEMLLSDDLYMITFGALECNLN